MRKRDLLYVVYSADFGRMANTLEVRWVLIMEWRQAAQFNDPLVYSVGFLAKIEFILQELRKRFL